MWMFLLGLVVGANVGLFIFALLQAARDPDDPEEVQTLRISLARLREARDRVERHNESLERTVEDLRAMAVKT